MNIGHNNKELNQVVLIGNRLFFN